MNGSSSSSSSSSGTPACAILPCSTDPCPPLEVVADSQTGMLTTDAESFFIGTSAQPSSIIRVPKPGCLVAPFDQPAQYPSYDHSVVSDGKYVAWISNDFSGACLSPALRFCDPANCKPQEVLAATTFPDQGEFTRVELGTDHLYFTMRNGLAGRLPKGSVQPEMLWIDPDSTSTQQAFLQYLTLAPDGKFFATRPWLGDRMAVCSSLANFGAGAIWSSDPTPNSTPTKIASNLSFVGPIAAGTNHVYFHINFGDVVLNRIPRTGGTTESLMANANHVATSLELQNLVVKNGWLYFRASTPSGEQEVVRLPVDNPTWSTDALETVVKVQNFRTFAVDDIAVYTDECMDPPNCTKYHVMARKLP